MPLPVAPSGRPRKLVGPIGLPVGQQKLGFRRDGVDHFAAQNPVLAVLGFEVAVLSERANLHVGGEGLAQVQPIPPEPRVQNGNRQPFAANPELLPAIDSQSARHLRRAARGTVQAIGFWGRGWRSRQPGPATTRPRGSRALSRPSATARPNASDPVQVRTRGGDVRAAGGITGWCIRWTASAGGMTRRSRQLILTAEALAGQVLDGQIGQAACEGGETLPVSPWLRLPEQRPCS